MKNTLLRYILITLCLTPCLAGCSGQGFLSSAVTGQEPCLAEVEIDALCAESACKSHMEDEDGIWDCNIYIYDSAGTVFSHSFHAFPSAQKGLAKIKTQLFLGEEYSVYMIANAGYDTGSMGLEELMDYKLYLSYPDGNLRGMAMAGSGDVRIDRIGQGASVQLERLMARIDISVDTGRLDPGISFQPVSAKLGNCARCTKAFRSYGVLSRDEIFASGYSADMTEAGYDYDSGSRISLYCMENIQNGPNTGFCTYVELYVKYRSGSCHSEGKGLVYRFYLQDGKEYGTRKNTVYSVTVRPEKDGLSGNDSWRLDKSNLVFSED